MNYTANLSIDYMMLSQTISLTILWSRGGPGYPPGYSCWNEKSGTFSNIAGELYYMMYIMMNYMPFSTDVQRCSQRF